MLNIFNILNFTQNNKMNLAISDFKNNFIRISSFLIILFIIYPPFNTWEKLIMLSISTTAIFFSNINFIVGKKKLFYLLIIFFLLFLQNIFSKQYVIVNHIVLPTSYSDEFDYIKNSFSNQVEKKLKLELSKLEVNENLLKNIKQPKSNKYSTLYKKYSFQIENIWSGVEEGKKVLIKNDLNFWDLGPAALNDPSLNFGDPNKNNYKNNLIFPVLFKINFLENNNNDKLCFTGTLFYENTNEFIFLENKKNQCIVIDHLIEYFFFDVDRELNIKIHNDNFLKYNYYLYFIVTLSSIIIFLLNIFRLNIFYLFLSVSFFLVFFIYFKFSPNDISNFSETIYFDRGMDGMAHYGYSRIIANHLFLGNYYESLKGVEEVYYFMPLTRYLNVILSFLFGDNILGNIFLISFFPIIIFKLINIFLDKKMSVYMTIIFLFIPIFEALGFTLINYINFTVDGYGEGVCYLFLILISYLYFNMNDKYSKYFFIGFLSFLVIGIRPNYIALLFPLIFFYICQIFLKRENIHGAYKKILLLVFGTSFLLLIPMHNYIYGKELVLLVKTENIQSSMHIKIFDYIKLIKFIFISDGENFNTLKIFNHLNHYIKFYEIWFIVTLLNLFLAVLINKNEKLRFFSLSLIIMHSTFLMFLGDPRYSMGAWLLSFIVFINMFKEVYYPYFSSKIFSAKQ